jgi:hypothetical protein
MPQTEKKAHQLMVSAKRPHLQYQQLKRNSSLFSVIMAEKLCVLCCSGRRGLPVIYLQLSNTSLYKDSCWKFLLTLTSRSTVSPLSSQDAYP